jgi:hypothetical protein
MRYQLRYIRAPRTTLSPVAKHDDSRLQLSRTNLKDGGQAAVAGKVKTADTPLREIEKPRPVLVLRHVMPDAALSQRIGPAVIGIAIGKWCVATEGAVTDAQEPRPD